MLRVVAVNPEDGRALAPFRVLLREYEESLPPDLRVPDLQLELQTLPQRYPAPSSALLLACHDGEAIGCVVVKCLDRATAELKRLYVAPTARRTGAGRALVEAAVAFARERAHQRVVLDTERDRLPAAYRLYRALGFSECAPYAPAEYCGPTFMELVLLPK